MPDSIPPSQLYPFSQPALTSFLLIILTRRLLLHFSSFRDTHSLTRRVLSRAVVSPLFWLPPLLSLPGETEAQRGQGLHKLQRAPVSHGQPVLVSPAQGRGSGEGGPLGPKTLPGLITEPLSSSRGWVPWGKAASPTFIPASCSFSFLLQSQCRWQ